MYKYQTTDIHSTIRSIYPSLLYLKILGKCIKITNGVYKINYYS